MPRRGEKHRRPPGGEKQRRNPTHSPDPCVEEFTAGKVQGTQSGSGASLPGSGASLPGSGASLPGSGASLPGSGASLPGSGDSLPGSGDSLPGSCGSQLDHTTTQACPTATQARPTATESTSSTTVHGPFIQPEPTATQPEPTATQPEPTATQPEPTATQPEPTATQPEPTATQPEPTATQPEPTATQPEPTATQPEPTATQPEPTATQPEPTATQPDSTATQPEPTATQPEPTATQPEPTATQPEPTATQPEPTATQPEPTATQPEPTATQPEPTATQPEPTATQPEPTATQPEPTATQPEPTATQPEPTATQPEPTATQPEPTATQLEPTATQPESTAAQPESTAAQPESTAAQPESTAAQPGSLQPNWGPVLIYRNPVLSGHSPVRPNHSPVRPSWAQLRPIWGQLLPSRGLLIPQAGSPATQTGSPAAQRGSPAAQRGSPAAQRGSPAAQRGSPAAQRGFSATRRGSSVNRRSSSVTQPGATSTQSGTPTFQQGSPTFQPGSPTSQPGSPTSQPGSPTSQPGSPTSQPGSPTSHRSSPATGQTLFELNPPPFSIPTPSKPEVQTSAAEDTTQAPPELPEDDQPTDLDLMVQCRDEITTLVERLINEVKEETLQAKFRFTDDEINKYKVLLQDDDRKGKEEIRSPRSPLGSDQNKSGSPGERGARAPTQDKQKVSKRSRSLSGGTIIDSTLDRVYAESEHQAEAKTYFPDFSVTNSIIRLSKLGSSFLSILDNELEEMIKWKYESILEKMDENQEQLDALMSIVKQVRLTAPDLKYLSNKVAFVSSLLDATGFKTVAELEETLKCHRMFILYTQHLIAARPGVEQPMGNVETVSMSSPSSAPSPAGQDSGSAQSTEEDVARVGCSPVPAFQPFLGDSSVRPKVRKPTHKRSSPESKGIGRDSKIKVKLDAAKAEKYGQAGKSKSPKHVHFEDEHPTTFREADSGGSNDSIILMGIKDNLVLAELLLNYVFGNGEAVNDIYMGAFRLQPEKIMSLIGCIPLPRLTLNEDASKDYSSAGSGFASEVCADTHQDASADVAPATSTDDTWQARVRSFYKRAIVNNPLERRGLQPTVAELRELCPKCHERYRWPHVLQCCHRFCFPCMVKLYQKDRNCFICPFFLCCSLQQNNSNFGPHSLTVDLTFARNMFEAKMSPFCCTNCNSLEDAVKFCETCLLYLCQECYFLHSQTEPNSQHKLENTDMKIGSTSDGKLLAMCTRHPGNSMTQFCKSCWSGVCGVCLQGDHKSHEILELNDVKEMIRERIQANNAHALELSIRFQRLLVDLKQSKQDIEASYRAGRHIIDEIRKRTHEKLAAVYQKTSEVTNRLFEKRRQQYIRAQEEQRVFSEEVEKFNQFVALCKQICTPQDALMISPIIRNRRAYLEEKSKNNSYLQKHFEFDFHANFEYECPDLTNAIKDMLATLNSELMSYLSRAVLHSQFIHGTATM